MPCRQKELVEQIIPKLREFDVEMGRGSMIVHHHPAKTHRLHRQEGVVSPLWKVHSMLWDR